MPAPRMGVEENWCLFRAIATDDVPCRHKGAGGRTVALYRGLYLQQTLPPVRSCLKCSMLFGQHILYNRNTSYQLQGNVLLFRYGKYTKKILLLYLWLAVTPCLLYMYSMICLCTPLRLSQHFFFVNKGNIVINGAAKPTKLSNNVSCCKFRISPSALTEIERVVPRADPRRYKRRLTLSPTVCTARLLEFVILLLISCEIVPPKSCCTDVCVCSLLCLFYIGY